MLRLTALLLTVLTGFSGLVYEVTWQKYLATLLGSHAEASAAVLGLFLGGLSLGYSRFGALSARLVQQARAAGRPPRLLLAYGVIEAGIGAWALAFPDLFDGVRAASAALPGGGGAWGFALDVGLSALLIGPPSVLMGGTIPILSQALSRSLPDATRLHAFVYAFNTAGAFAGALAAGFVLVPALGLVGVLQAMGVLNLGVGASFVLLGLRPAVALDLGAESDAPRVAGLGRWALVALLSGFAMMCLQTVLIRVGGLSLGASPFTFSTVVAVFVLCIALGSFGVSALPRIPAWALPVSQALLAAMLLALHPLLGAAPLGAQLLRASFGRLESEFLPYHLSVFAALLVLMGPAVVVSGATLPLLFHQLRREAAQLGSVAGTLYGWNTVGSLLGALLGGYLLLFWLDLDQVYKLAVGTVMIGAVLVLSLLAPLSRWAPPVLLAPGLLALLLLGSWDPRLFASGLFLVRDAVDAETLDLTWRSKRIRSYEDGPVSSVAVLEHVVPPGDVSLSIVTNGKVDGNTHLDYPTMGLLAALPALMADRAERAFVIGYGTGITVGELASLDSMREVVVAEISHEVVKAAPLFDFASLEASTNPAVRIVRSDAYRALMRSDGRFDVIVSEPSNPWVTGIEMLYSREFLEAARGRLSPGGVFAQWYHQYDTDSAAVALVLRTYISVFDHVAVWYGLGSDLILLGIQSPERALDLDRLEARVAEPGFAAMLERSKIESLPALFAHELVPVGVLHAAGLRGPLHSLYHPRLSDLASRAFFRGRVAGLPFTGYGEPARLGAERSLIRLLAARSGALPDGARESWLRELCRHRPGSCASALAAWWAEDPGAPLVAAFLDDPKSLRRVGIAPLDVEHVRALRALFAEDPSAAATLAEARSASEWFRRSYTHAAPFRPKALLDLWRRACAAGGGRPCVRGFARARDLVERGGRRSAVPALSASAAEAGP